MLTTSSRHLHDVGAALVSADAELAAMPGRGSGTHCRAPDPTRCWNPQHADLRVIHWIPACVHDTARDGAAMKDWNRHPVDRLTIREHQRTHIRSKCAACRRISRIEIGGLVDREGERTGR